MFPSVTPVHAARTLGANITNPITKDFSAVKILTMGIRRLPSEAA